MIKIGKDYTIVSLPESYHARRYTGGKKKQTRKQVSRATPTNLLATSVN